MPIWGLSTESMKPWPLPVVVKVVEPSDGDGAGVRVFQGCCRYMLLVCGSPRPCRAVSRVSFQSFAGEKKSN